MEEADGGFEGVQVGTEVFEFGGAEVEREGVVDGAEADGRVGVAHGVGEDGDTERGEFQEFRTGDVGGLAAEFGEAGAEGGIGEPAAQGGLADTGGAGGLDDGGETGDDGEGGLLAWRKCGKVDFPLISANAGRELGGSGGCMGTARGALRALSVVLAGG